MLSQSSIYLFLPISFHFFFGKPVTHFNWSGVLPHPLHLLLCLALLVGPPSLLLPQAKRAYWTYPWQRLLPTPLTTTFPLISAGHSTHRGLPTSLQQHHQAAVHYELHFDPCCLGQHFQNLEPAMHLLGRFSSSEHQRPIIYPSNWRCCSQIIRARSLQCHVHLLPN